MVTFLLMLLITEKEFLQKKNLKNCFAKIKKVIFTFVVDDRKYTQVLEEIKKM